jgi:hypothetical protein
MSELSNGKDVRSHIFSIKIEYNDDDNYLVLYLAVHDHLSVHSA